MRRWNGWGDDGVERDAPPAAFAYIAERVGNASPPRDASLAEALHTVPKSGLATMPGVDCGAESRLRHARGQSFPDWLAMRYGRMGPFPDGVATPRCHDDVVAILDQAVRRGVAVIPYGGGTSVVGHLQAEGQGRPVLSLDLSQLARLTDLEPRSRLATIGAGAPGPVVEAQLRAAGYVLGHFPQSWDYSTLGGWVVTRSSGQQSLRYGRIEPLFAGGRLVTPAGPLGLPTTPASAAGPDVRDLVLGSEGRLGVLTEAVVRIRPAPEVEDFHVVFFGDWESAATAVRSLSQAELGLSMLRLSNPAETETQLLLAGHPRAIGTLDRYLRLRGLGQGRCMLLIGITGARVACRLARSAALAIARRHGGVHTGRAIGKAWAASRFSGPYFRNTLWAAGYGVDTVETAVDWPRVTATMEAVEAAARDALAGFDERLHCFTHLSHVYPQGSSLYSTFVFRAGGDYDTDLARWQTLKARVSEAIVAGGGTISHQHGVGKDHQPYLAAEKGELGLRLLHQAMTALDPQGLMNPGKLVAEPANTKG